jgi:hypothetical protein
MTASGCVPMWAVRRQHGAASVEFFVTFAVVIMLIMGILQMGMFFVAKNTVNLATFAAARAGAASGGDRSQMQQAFAKALSGLYVAKGLRLANSNGLTDVSSSNFETVISGATAWAYGLALLPYDQMVILNPRQAAFADFGAPDPAGGRGRIIPVTGLLTDTAVGRSSRQTRADALLLKLEVRHCYEMIFPVIDKAVSELILSTALGQPASDLACYAKHPSPDGRMVYGVPVVSQAVVRMTTPAIQGNFK